MVESHANSPKLRTYRLSVDLDLEDHWGLVALATGTQMTYQAFSPYPSNFLFTHWEVGKYTKRRASTVPEFDPKTREFYEKNYVDGHYLHRSASTQERTPQAHLAQFARCQFQYRSGSARCSEAYTFN
ncbi:hypothetical protein IWQ61_000040 [Dispira simplex]|nr:hypothetical protein IWQ61_000040 [Dispira simplex]